MNSTIIKSVGTAISKMGFKCKKHSPEILIIAGVVGTVTSAVLACKATTKLSDILDDTKNDLGAINDAKNNDKLADVYSEEDAKKDVAIVYTNTVVKLVKLYVPSVALGVLSITSILASNNILRKRNVALAAAYSTIDTTFKKYRDRVVDRFGDRVDKELRYNIKAKEIEETTVDGKGKEKIVKKTIDTVDDQLNIASDYARFFDECSRYWEKDSEYNLMFLKTQQNYANNLLRANGRVFLNEVYEMLDIPKTKAGQVVGWVYDKDNTKGDNYIDFGIFDTHKASTREFVNGYERVILLDFNVDGNIWENM